MLTYGNKVHNWIFIGESPGLSVKFEEKVVFLQMFHQCRRRIKFFDAMMFSLQGTRSLSCTQQPFVLSSLVLLKTS